MVFFIFCISPGATVWAAIVNTGTCSLQTMYWNLPLGRMDSFFAPDDIPMTTDDIDPDKMCVVLNCATGNTVSVSCTDKYESVCLANCKFTSFTY